MESKVDRVIDVSGLLGPGPSLLTRGALQELKAGEILEVISSDKGVEQAVMELCGDGGCRLLEVREETGLFHFVIRKVGV
jgi:TusA-related sulfurtransferase